jgi:hypothetical protein
MTQESVIGELSEDQLAEVVGGSGNKRGIGAQVESLPPHAQNFFSQEEPAREIFSQTEPVGQERMGQERMDFIMKELESQEREA